MTLTAKILLHHAVGLDRPWVEIGDILRIKVDWTIASELAWNGMNATYQKLGCWTPHVEITKHAYEKTAKDKRKVIQEAFRVLKPGGRFAVSDVVVRGNPPAEVRTSMELWVGCIAGALDEKDFVRFLSEAGFEAPSIEPTRIYQAPDAAAFLAGLGLDAIRLAEEIDGKFMSAFIRATKPSNVAASSAAASSVAASSAAKSCCGPECCA